MKAGDNTGLNDGPKLGVTIFIYLFIYLFFETRFFYVVALAILELTMQTRLP